MKVGELIQSDKEEWSRLYHGYAEFYEMEMNQDILDTVWSWIFNPDNKFFAIVVRSNENELIGFMHFREMPSPLRGKLVGFLHHLFEDPVFRGS